MLKDSLLKFLKIDNLIENITGYVESRIELMKLEMKEELSKVLAKALFFVFISCIFTLFVMLLSIAVAVKIGETTGTFGGFAIVAGFYLLICVLMYIFRNAIGGKVEQLLQDIMNKKKK